MSILFYAQQQSTNILLLSCYIQIFLFIILSLLIGEIFTATTTNKKLPFCNNQTDYKYEFTECDAFGGKWRVMVPNIPGQCIGTISSFTPTRVHSCYTSCEGGQFFNKSTLLCENCQPGHYSLSGGRVFDNFGNTNELPEGFHIITQSKQLNIIDDTNINKCPEWQVDKTTGSLISMIDMKPDNIESGCISAVTFTAKVMMKKGRLRFTYHYKTPNHMPLSLLFTFNYRLYDGIGVIEDDINTNIKFPMATMDKKLETIELLLNSPGLYVFTWKSILIKNFRNYFGLSSSSSSSNFGNYFMNTGDSRDIGFINHHHQYRENIFQNKLSTIGIIRIEKIIIEGVAYASECTPCEPGTYAPESGMKECLLCPRNTAFNGSGATNCTRCDPITEYASPGSTRCFKRPICGLNDFYQIPIETCNEQTLKQKIEYKWIEPKICVDLNQIFPVGIHYINCNVTNNKSTDVDCDLGMELKSLSSSSNEKYCQFCPDGYYRDENMSQCEPCPPITNPFYALLIRHWNNSLPGWSTTAATTTNNNLFEDDSNNQLDYSLYLNSYFNRECFRSNEDIISNREIRSIDGVFTFDDGNDDMMKGAECSNQVTWQPFNDHIRTGPSAPLDAYLILSLAVPAFRSVNTNETKLIFEFELNCQLEDQCQLLFVETKNDESDLRLQDLYEKDPQSSSSSYNRRRNNFSLSQQTNNINQVIKEWTESSKIIKYQHQIEQNNNSLTFSWIFKRTNSFQSYAKIYSLMLIGSMVGSAIKCQTCPILSKSSAQCISCPLGQYLEHVIEDTINNDTSSWFNKLQSSSSSSSSSSNNYQCKNCPLNHILNSSSSLSLGIESCIKCGENLISDNQTNICFSNCLVSFNQEHRQDNYNLSELPQPIHYKGINLFTSGGTQYMNLFKITLCGNRKRDQLSTCLNNITVLSDDSSGVRSFICRSTIIPDGSKIFSAQSSSLGDELIGITRETTFLNMTVHKDFVESPEANKYDQDYHLYFRTQTPTGACPNGRRLTITMRCKPNGNGEMAKTVVVKTPNSCPDGTCNGCDFHLLIETNTAAACRICHPYSEDDFETVIGECLDGTQQVHYLNPKECVVLKKDENQNQSNTKIENSNIKYVLNRPCSLLLPKQVQIGIAMALALGLLLLLLVFYFWNKNRSLEYKYTKLIEHTSEYGGGGGGGNGRGKGGRGNDDLSFDNCCVVEDDDYQDDEEINYDNNKSNLDHHQNASNKSTNKQHHNTNNRLDNRMKTELTKMVHLVESQEMQQLFPSPSSTTTESTELIDTNNKLIDNNNKRANIDDEGYETIHLISANNSNNNNNNNNNNNSTQHNIRGNLKV